jgi:alpha-D-xyloside xylohydrolase
LARGPVKQFANQRSDVPISLTVYPGADGTSTLYADDGHTFAFERGDFSSVRLRWDDAAAALALSSSEGKRQSEQHFTVGLAGMAPKQILYAGTETKVPLR